MTNVIEFLRNMISKFVDQFKLKNPTAFLIVAGLVYAIWFVLDGLIKNGQIIDFPVNFPVIGEIYVLDALIKTLVFLLTITGAHTPKQPQIEIPITPHTEITEP